MTLQEMREKRAEALKEIETHAGSLNLSLNSVASL